MSEKWRTLAVGLENAAYANGATSENYHASATAQDRADKASRRAMDALCLEVERIVAERDAAISRAEGYADVIREKLPCGRYAGDPDAWVSALEQLGNLRRERDALRAEVAALRALFAEPEVDVDVIDREQRVVSRRYIIDAIEYESVEGVE